MTEKPAAELQEMAGIISTERFSLELPSDFQKKLLNEYEKANIFLMQQYSEDL